MANICNYVIRAKGTKKAALMMFAATPKAGDFDYITGESGSENDYIVWYEGECKWSLDAYSSEMNVSSIDLDEYSVSQLRSGECNYSLWSMTMRQKTELLGLDVYIHTWSEDSEFNEYIHLNCGVVIPCSEEEWDDLEIIDTIPIDDEGSCSFADSQSSNDPLDLLMDKILDDDELLDTFMNDKEVDDNLLASLLGGDEDSE